MMAGMGRPFDSSYAEYTCAAAANVPPLETTLAGEALGALPEMLQTCHGSGHHTRLSIEAGHTLLIRGGTSPIGLTTAAMAARAGAHVIATSRSDLKAQLLRTAESKDVLIDNGELPPSLRGTHPDGGDRVLELVGASTMLDSLRCGRTGGVV